LELETRNLEFGTRNWRSAAPHQARAFLFDMFSMDEKEFFFEACEGLIVQLKAEF
jgi:hypothetical protein